MLVLLALATGVALVWLRAGSGPSRLVVSQDGACPRCAKFRATAGPGFKYGRRWVVPREACVSRSCSFHLDSSPRCNVLFNFSMSHVAPSHPPQTRTNQLTGPLPSSLPSVVSRQRPMPELAICPMALSSCCPIRQTERCAHAGNARCADAPRTNCIRTPPAAEAPNFATLYRHPPARSSNMFA